MRQDSFGHHSVLSLLCARTATSFRDHGTAELQAVTGRARGHVWRPECNEPMFVREKNVGPRRLLVG